MELYECQAINVKVRAFFKPGNKSGNKRYYVNHGGVAEQEKIDRLHDDGLEGQAGVRNFNSVNANDQVKTFRKEGKSRTYAQDAAALVLQKTDTFTPAGNCSEMAALSARYADETKLAPRKCIYIGEFDEPGDHTFCLVSARELSELERKHATLAEFTETKLAMRSFIIDPWLNVACRGRFYLFSANLQLNRWHIRGKRIAWKHGKQGKGWYPAGGEYQDKFSVAPLRLLPF
jgi:hypothetical protein